MIIGGKWTTGGTFLKYLFLEYIRKTELAQQIHDFLANVAQMILQ